jgi:hypothetical protein
MELAFNTINTLYLACVLLMTYILTLAFQRKISKVELDHSGKIYLSSISIVAGVKLIYATVIFLHTGIIDTDKLYTIYGAFYVVRSAVLSFYRILTMTV